MALFSKFRVVFCILLSGLFFSQAEARVLDIASLSKLKQTQVLVLLNDWPNAHAALEKFGNKDKAHQQFLIELIPEILADILIDRSGTLGKLKSVDLIIIGKNAPDISVSLRTLPLYKTLQSVLDSPNQPKSVIINLARSSAFADSLSKAVKGGADLNGAAAATALIGIRHDGKKLILAAK